MSEFNEDSFSISADKYIAKHHILTYLEDSIKQLLEHKEENPKVVPAKFFYEYLRDGNQTMFREFAFVRSTPHNRLSFVHLFWKCYRQLGKKGDLLSIQEYHSLLGLLCPDFPFQLVQNTARIVLIDDALDCLVSFSDFIYAFQVQFYFEEFLDKASKIYQDILQTVHSPRDPVIVPTSGEMGAKIHQNTHQPADGVDAMQFFRAIYPLLNKVAYSTPHQACLKEILFSVSRISFYEFLMAVAKSDSINTHLGRLPGRTELLEGADDEFTSQQQKIPRQINKQKVRKANENTVARASQKVQGNTRLTKSSSSSSLPEISFTRPTDTVTSSTSSTLKVRNSQHRVKKKGQISRLQSDTESDSGSSAETSDTN